MMSAEEEDDLAYDHIPLELLGRETVPHVSRTARHIAGQDTPPNDSVSSSEIAEAPEYINHASDDKEKGSYTSYTKSATLSTHSENIERDLARSRSWRSSLLQEKVTPSSCLNLIGPYIHGLYIILCYITDLIIDASGSCKTTEKFQYKLSILIFNFRILSFQCEKL